MSDQKTQITLAKLETIASTTTDNEVRVLAETMSRYVKEHESAHRVEVTQELGFVPPVPEVKS